jgi:hypothetical protein
MTLTLLGNGSDQRQPHQFISRRHVTTVNGGGNWTMVDNPTSAAITLASGSFNIINGTLNYGTATSAPNFTVTTASDHTVGNAASNGVLNFVNGTLLLKTRLNTINGALNVSTGTLQVWNQFQQANGAVANISTRP